MKTHLFLPTIAVITSFVFAGCSDPSNNVHKSSTSDPQQAPSAPPASGKLYVFQPDSTIGFVGSKVTGSHDGGFKEFTGKLTVADGKVVPPAEIKISMSSTWADNNRLTTHLKSADFFGVDEHPTSTFTVTAIEPSGQGYKVTGNLDLHGVTKSISFPADIQVAEDAVTVKAEFAINRKDFKINYPGNPDDLIRDNVVIKLDVRGAPAGAKL